MTMARNDCPDYDTVIKIATGQHIEGGFRGYGDPAYEVLDYGDGAYILLHGTDAHAPIPDEFWDHVERATGVKPPVRAKGFSCSC